MAPAVRVAFALGILQLALHLAAVGWVGDPRMIAPHGVALLHDFLVLAVVSLGLTWAGRILPAGWKDSTAVAGTLFVGILLSVYPQLLRDYLGFPVNVFDAGPEAGATLLTTYLGFRSLMPAAVAAVIGTAALFCPLPSIQLGRGSKAVAFLLLGGGLLTLPGSPNPWLHSGAQSLSAFAFPGRRTVDSLARPVGNDGAGMVAGLKPEARVPAGAASHIFFIVMEGVSAREFEDRFLGADGDVHIAGLEEPLYFQNYHSTNLDSHTSLIAMLTGVQVPYRAYADVSLYSGVDGASNLPRLFRDAGFRTSFISTYRHQPFVPARGDWDDILDGGDLVSDDKWLGVEGSPIEAAFEDKAAIGAIARLAATHDKTFILHELAYGHSDEWMKTGGGSQLDYYEQYLRELSSVLEKIGIPGDSLLVIVSDHGDRTLEDVAENYRVPLLLSGKGVSPGTDTFFRNHLDLPPIVLGAMGGGDIPPERQEIFVVGPTGRWVYGRILRDKSALFIDNESGTVTTKRGEDEPSAVRSGFQELLNRFDGTFGRGRSPSP